MVNGYKESIMIALHKNGPRSFDQLMDDCDIAYSEKERFDGKLHWLIKAGYVYEYRHVYALTTLGKMITAGYQGDLI